MSEQNFWFINVKGELLTYEQFLERREEALWMTMVRNIGREDAPTWGIEKSQESERT